jgi:flagellar motor protein MotB
MAKKKKLEPSTPSKAYLVSFGDTMTALLAFFIVINSLAKEQTGADMYSGTGSFVTAFSSSGLPGTLAGDRSSEMLQQQEQMPIYALAKNLDQNEGGIGPDETEDKDRIVDRDKEQFQKFLVDIEKSFGLQDHKPLENQTVVDSFAPLNLDAGIRKEAIQLLSESIAKLRQPEVNLEVIIWATMPSKQNLDRQLDKSIDLRAEIERMFWLKPQDRARIRYRVKPWLFSDAKRPVLSVVFSKTGEPAR